MPYQVLARKYRPQRFSDVVGQDHVTRTLLNALAQGRIAHGYIFSGHRGIGKTTIARILAMALNCSAAVGSPERPTHEPCLACVNCREISSASRQESSVFEESHSFDVEEIDAATNRGIDDARLLTSKIQARPTNKSKYRIIILDEAHQITDAAWNALLKTLEEPPEWAVFMFATTQAEDIPQTIRSRCQHFTFHAVKFEAIVGQLRSIAARESIGASDETLALLAEAGDGSMRDALSIMDQAIASAPHVSAPNAPAVGASAGEPGTPRLDPAQIRELMGTVPNAVFERLLESVSENQSAPILEEINRLLNAGNSASQLARQLTRYLRNTLMARLAGEGSELLQLSPDERARVGRSALLFSEEDLTRFLQVMLRTFDELNYRQEPRFHLELGLLKMVHLQRLLPVEQLLSQLGGTAAGAGATKVGGGPLPGRAAPSASNVLSHPSAATPDARPSASVASRSAPTEERPAFSPFEQDSRRKSPELPRPQPPRTVPRAHGGDPAPANSTAAAAEIARPGLGTTTAALLEEQPGQEAERVGESLAHASPPAGTIETSVAPEQTPGDSHLSAPSTAEMSNPDEATQSGEGRGEPEQARREQQAQPGSSLEELRNRIVTALDQAGHNTAAALLGDGVWTEQNEAIQIEIAATKTMLGLAMNAEVEKICRETVRAVLGRARPMTFVPGRGTRAASRPVSVGSAQARALENPLVKQAQELFGAEIRSVLDLRKP